MGNISIALKNECIYHICIKSFNGFWQFLEIIVKKRQVFEKLHVSVY